MKKVYLPILITTILLLASNLPAVEITYNVTSGGKSSSLTTDYDLSAGSRADSQIDITSNPSISSHTNVNAQGDENNIEVTTGANDGAGSTSNASVRILDNVETASINTNANASNSTQASANATGTGAMAGYIKGESDGTKKFCAFTGDFDASSDAGGGNVGITSNYTKANANIFIVTKDQNNTPCHDTVYDDIPDVFDPNTGPPETPSNKEGRPDYAFVDHGGFTGAEIDTKPDLTLSGVWGADNTTIDGRDGGGDTLYVHNSPNFTVEGFTVTGGTNVDEKNLELENGGVTDRTLGNGISIYNSDNATVRDNTVSGNAWHGIHLIAGGFNEVTGNTANKNGIAGIFVFSGDNVTVTCNTANGNGLAGIGVSSDGNATVTGNTANENGGFGIGVWPDGNATVTGNTANENGGFGIEVLSVGDATVTGNTANGNGGFGIGVLSVGNATVTGNTANGNGVGIYIAGFGGTAKVNYNNIFSNTVGLLNDTGKNVNAEENWWGPGGTGGPGEGPAGNKNNGVFNVGTGTTDFTPWSNVKF